MKRKIYNFIVIGILISFSGCDKNTPSPQKPHIDSSLPVVSSKYIRTKQDITSVALEWKSIKDPKCKGYYIIRADMQNNGKYKRIASVQNKYSSHFLDRNLNPNSKYGYKISMFTKDGRESQPSDTIFSTTLPNLKSVSLAEAISGLPRQIKILWRPHTDKRVSKYIIERKSPLDTSWEKIATIDARLKVEYIDTDLKDKDTYSYRIKAITFDGIVSDPSKILTATTKALPNQVQTLSTTTTLPRKIQLSWTKSSTKDVVSYNIYRSSSAKGSYTKIATAPVEHNRFDDDINEDGKIYFYKLTTVDKDNLESKLDDIQPVMGVTLSKPKSPKITLAQTQGDKVILNWVPSDDRTVSYNIYKIAHEGWNPKETIKRNITDKRWVDTDVVRGIEYDYMLQAIDKYGLVSEKTAKSTLKLPKLTPITQAGN